MYIFDMIHINLKIKLKIKNQFTYLVFCFSVMPRHLRLRGGKADENQMPTSDVQEQEISKERFVIQPLFDE